MTLCSYLRGSRFDRPYFISPHAVKQFQRRIAPVPAAEVIRAVQQMLQNPGPPVDIEERDGKVLPIYRGWYRGKLVYIPVAAGEGEWPCVPTVWGIRSKLHKKLCRRRPRDLRVSDAE